MSAEIVVVRKCDIWNEESEGKIYFLPGRIYSCAGTTLNTGTIRFLEFLWQIYLTYRRKELLSILLTMSLSLCEKYLSSLFILFPFLHFSHYSKYQLIRQHHKTFRP